MCVPPALVTGKPVGSASKA